VMGYLYGQLGSFAIGLAALAVVALGALLLTVTVVRRAMPAVRRPIPAGRA
jgi:MFS transporter, NNP family, nitrate/nitrite transporter